MKTIYKHEHKNKVSGQSDEKNVSVENNTSETKIPEENAVIDKTKEQKTVEPKKDNAWIWGLLVIAVLALVYYLTNMKQNEKAN